MPGLCAVLAASLRSLLADKLWSDQLTVIDGVALEVRLRPASGSSALPTPPPHSAPRRGRAPLPWPSLRRHMVGRMRSSWPSRRRWTQRATCTWLHATCLSWTSHCRACVFGLQSRRPPLPCLRIARCSDSCGRHHVGTCCVAACLVALTCPSARRCPPSTPPVRRSTLTFTASSSGASLS